MPDLSSRFNGLPPELAAAIDKLSDESRTNMHFVGSFETAVFNTKAVSAVVGEYFRFTDSGDVDINGSGVLASVAAGDYVLCLESYTEPEVPSAENLGFFLFSGSLSGVGLAEIETGWLSGGDVTINGGDPAKYDIASGTIWVQGQTAPVSFGPFIGVSPTDIATTQFTGNAINAAGALVQRNTTPTPAERRTTALLQYAVHVDNATVTSIDDTRHLAQHVTSALVDFAFAIGSLNKGNNYLPRASDTTTQKLEGITSLIHFQGAVSLTAPNDKTDVAEDPVTGIVQISRDGAGGFDRVFINSIPVGFWDNDTGTLLATPKYVIYQMRFLAGVTACIVGQQTYDTLDEAVANVFVADPVLPSSVTQILNNYRTAIVAKGDVTDFEAAVIAGTARFVQIDPSAPGGVVEQGLVQ